MKINHFALCVAIASIIACTSNSNSERELYRILEDDKYGFIDCEGNVKIEPQFEYASHFFNGYSTVVIDHEMIRDTSSVFSWSTRRITYNYINESGKFLLDNNLTYEANTEFDLLPEISEILYDLRFESNLALYRNENGLYGYINHKGKIQIPCEYNAARAFSDNKAAVYKVNEGWGFINHDGSIFIKPQYSSVQDYKYGLSSASIMVSDYEFHDEEVTLPKFDQVVLDGNGRIVGTPKTLYKQFSTFSKDSIAVAPHFIIGLLGNKYVDGSGNFLPTVETPNIEDREYANFIIETAESNAILKAGEFSEGVAPISFNGEIYLYIDKYFVPQHDKNTIYTYEDARSFMHGLAAIKKDGKWGFINNKFEEVIPCQYDSCMYYFEGDLARVYTKAENYLIETYINKNNQPVWQAVRRQK